MAAASSGQQAGLAKPRPDHRAGLGPQPRPVPRRLFAQLRNIHARSVQLHRVTDEPLLDPAGIDLRMELEADDPRAQRERLVLAGRGRCEERRACRKGEGVTVPVERYRILLEGREAGRAACIRERDGSEPDLGPGRHGRRALPQLSRSAGPPGRFP